MTSDINEVLELIRKFRDDRDWKQYHDPKNLAINLSIEAAELLENFLWNRPVDSDNVKKELADVLYTAFLIADSYAFDIKEIIVDKLQENAIKYPISKTRGINKKYTDL